MGSSSRWKTMPLNILLLLLSFSTNPMQVVASDCEDGWEENGGKCYFFSQDKRTWVGADEECNMKNGSHLASVTDQQTNDFIAGKLKKGESMWIGAKQTFESDKGSWAWADGCSPNTIVLDKSTIVAGTATPIAIGLFTIVLVLIIAVAVLTFKLKKNRKRERGANVKTDENALYGLYYNADGERVDQGNVYAEDQNDYYAKS